VKNKEYACLKQEQIFIRSNFLQNCIVQGVQQYIVVQLVKKNSRLFWKSWLITALTKVTHRIP
jgi:hypothetical protein